MDIPVRKERKIVFPEYAFSLSFHFGKLGLWPTT
jgi:hypothetical protein